MGKVFKALEKSQGEYDSGTNGDIEHGEVGEKPLKVGKLEAVEVEQPFQSGPKNPATGHWDERLLKVTGYSGRLSESFRVLRSRILHPTDDGKRMKTILVTSTTAGEGKSFVSANLAISLARGMDQYCLVVDCDLRRPTLARLFGMENDLGLSDYLQKTQDVSGVIRKTSVDKLSIIASGRPPVNPSELLGSARMQGLVQQLSSRYEDRIIIFDSPPNQMASETSVLAKQVDGVVVVVRWGTSGRDLVKRLVDDIGRKKILGVVFNGYKTNIIESKLLNYYSHYQYEYNRK